MRGPLRDEHDGEAAHVYRQRSGATTAAASASKRELAAAAALSFAVPFACLTATDHSWRAVFAAATAALRRREAVERDSEDLVAAPEAPAFDADFGALAGGSDALLGLEPLRFLERELLAE